MKTQITSSLHILAGFALVSLFGACSTGSGSSRELSASDFEEKIVARMNDSGSRPDWLDESAVFVASDNVVTALGRSTLPADSRIEMGYRIAELNAKSTLAAAIESKLESVFQSAEEGASLDQSQYRSAATEVTRLTTSSLRVTHRYWEKVLTRDGSGSKTVRYQIFAQVSMPEPDFKRAVIAAARRLDGRPELSEAFAKKVEQQWNSLTREPAAGKKSGIQE